MVCCKEVHRIAYFYLDGTLGVLRREEISQHLTDCKDCDDRFAIHRRMREFLQSRLQRVTAPTALRDRLLQARG